MRNLTYIITKICEGIDRITMFLKWSNIIENFSRKVNWNPSTCFSLNSTILILLEIYESILLLRVIE